MMTITHRIKLNVSFYCQKSRTSNMDDDMCIKSGLVKAGGCECASTRGSVNLYSSRDCMWREYIRVDNFAMAHLIKDCRPVKRPLK